MHACVCDGPVAADHKCYWGESKGLNRRGGGNHAGHFLLSAFLSVCVCAGLIRYVALQCGFACFSDEAS